MATAAMQALDEPEPRGAIFDLVYDSIRGALLRDTDYSTTAAAMAVAAASSSDSEVDDDQAYC